jgi:putative phage-type endonuclease
MNRQLLTFKTEAEWLAMREADLTSTEVSALFGCSPYMTEYELYHRKKGQVVIEFEVNNRMVWGNRLEAAIANGIAEDLGLLVEPFKVYGRIPELRMGSSFDYKVVGIALDWSKPSNEYRELFLDHGPGIMEVKNVDGLQFRRGWVSGEDCEAPPHIELQVQHQLEVTGLPYAIMAPLVGGNTPMPFYRMRNLHHGMAIKEKIEGFWQRFGDGRVPDPDFTRDGDIIAMLLGDDDGNTVDLSHNLRLAELSIIHGQASAEFDKAEKLKKACKAEILTLIGTAKKAVGDGFYVSAGTVKGSAGTLVTPELVGKVIGGREGYRAMRIYKKAGV